MTDIPVTMPTPEEIKKEKHRERAKRYCERQKAKKKALKRGKPAKRHSGGRKAGGRTRSAARLVRRKDGRPTCLFACRLVLKHWGKNDPAVKEAVKGAISRMLQKRAKNRRSERKETPTKYI